VQLVFAQSEGLPHDVPALLRAAVAELGGRGGGRGNLAQGGGDRVERLDAALAAARAALASPR
jgi:alanyl-tRNA synthetase